MHHKVDRLLLHLDARVEAFAMCEVAQGWRLDLGPMPTPLLHYVIGGTGRLAGHPELLAPGTLIVVPAGQSHQLQAPGRTRRVQEGMSEFPRADRGSAAHFGRRRTGAAHRLRHGDDPLPASSRSVLRHHCADGLRSGNAAGRIPEVFDNLVAELEEPRFGSRAIASALLKQVLVLLLRAQIDGEGTRARMGDIAARSARRAGHGRDAGCWRSPAIGGGSGANVAGMSRAAFQRSFWRSSA